MFPNGYSETAVGPKPFPLEGTLRSRRTSSLARNPPHPTCASPTRAPSERGQDPNISQSFSHVVDVPSSSRIDQALFIRSGLHAGRHDTRANRQNQFRTRLGQGVKTPLPHPEPTPQTGPTTTRYTRTGRLPPEPVWRFDGYARADGQSPVLGN